MCRRAICAWMMWLRVGSGLGERAKRRVARVASSLARVSVVSVMVVRGSTAAVFPGSGGMSASLMCVGRRVVVV